MEAEIDRQNCPKTNALIPTSSRAVVRSTFDRLGSTGRVTEAWNTLRGSTPIKKKNRITGVQIRTATGGLEDLFSGRLLRRGC